MSYTNDLRKELANAKNWFDSGAMMVKDGRLMPASFNERLRVYMEVERLKILINLKETFKIKVYDRRTNINDHQEN